MTAEIVYVCKHEGCRRARVYPDQPFCADHRLRFVSDAKPFVPEWRKRLIAKDFTGSAA